MGLRLNLFLACAFLASSAASAEKRYRDQDFIELQTGAATIAYSPALQGQADEFSLKFAAGVAYLQRSFSGEGLPAAPRYWLAAGPEEMRDLLQQRQVTADRAELDLAARLGVYSAGAEVFLICPAGADPGGAMATAFHDLARRYVSVQGGRGIEQAPWFSAGLAQLMALRALDGRSGEAVVAALRTEVELPAGRPLQSLEQAGHWRQAIVSNPQETLKVATLAVAYLETQSGPSTAAAILGQLHSGAPFAQAFERSSGMRLYEFEQRFLREFRRQKPASGRRTPV
ncbi:MAG: hypothetical protein K1X75_02340 [Leptospirales bacterium]|nr:hypothetical protein [Leptospirales bacterium]